MHKKLAVFKRTLIGLLFGVTALQAEIILQCPGHHNGFSFTLNDMSQKIRGITVVNRDGVSHVGRFNVKVYHDHNRVARLESNIVHIPASSSVRVGDLNIGFSDLWFEPSIKNIILRTNKFPAGTYEVVIEFIYEDGTATCEWSFSILNPPPPTLVYPSDGQTLLETRPNFTWTPVPTQGSFVQYVVELFEVRANETAEEALRRIPIWHISVRGATSVGYPLEAPPLRSGVKYVWRVKAVDENGLPVGENNGESEPAVFTVETNASNYTVNDVIFILMQKISELQKPESRALLFTKLLRNGDVVGDRLNPYEMIVNEDSWLGWIDTAPDKPFPHDVFFVLVNANTGETTLKKSSWPPLINGRTPQQADVVVVKEGF